MQSSRRWDMIARFLTPEQSGHELLDYARRHPQALQQLARFMGYRLDGNDQEDTRALGQALSMITFRPKASTED